MAYDEHLAERIRNIFAQKKVDFIEKKMMGGLCFMVDDKMCVGVMGTKDLSQNQIMARIGPEVYESAMQKRGCHEMNFTGRPMRGFVFVDDHAIDLDEDLDHWVQLCLNYNPMAQSSKKKKKN